MPEAKELMEQAHMTAYEYMRYAKMDVDAQFGPGYAEAHPELVAAYMQTAALDFLVTFGLQGLASELGRIADALDK
jgi:hypothetical protein